MPLYSIEFSREAFYRIEVEAESLADARAKAEQMTRFEIAAAHDFDGEFELDGVYPIDDEGNQIDEPPAEPMSTRLGGDELMHNLMAGDGHNLPVETCQ
jgi:hypothetical protein